MDQVFVLPEEVQVVNSIVPWCRIVPADVLPGRDQKSCRAWHYMLLHAYAFNKHYTVTAMTYTV